MKIQQYKTQIKTWLCFSEKANIVIYSKGPVRGKKEGERKSKFKKST